MCDFSRVTSVQIFSGLKDIGRNPFVYALVVVVLVTTVVLYAFARWLAARAGGHRVGAAKGVRAHRPRRLRPLAGALVAATLAAVVGVAALPNVSVVLLALSRDWYGTILPSGLTLDHLRAALTHDVVVPSIANSLRYVDAVDRLRSGRRHGDRLPGHPHPLARRARARRRGDVAAGGARPGDGVRLPRDLARGAAAVVSESAARSDGAAGHRLRRAPAAVRRPFRGRRVCPDIDHAGGGSGDRGRRRDLDLQARHAAAAGAAPAGGRACSPSRSPCSRCPIR